MPQAREVASYRYPSECERGQLCRKTGPLSREPEYSEIDSSSPLPSLIRIAASS